MQLDHPNIIKLYDIYEDAEDFHTVLEFCEGASLAKRTLNEKQAAIVIR